MQREEALRQEIKALARSVRTQQPGNRNLHPATPTQAALLVRFSRTGEIFLFRRTLAASLGVSEALAERILLDVSGRQLALVLSALSVDIVDAASCADGHLSASWRAPSALPPRPITSSGRRQ